MRNPCLRLRFRRLLRYFFVALQRGTGFSFFGLGERGGGGDTLVYKEYIDLYTDE